MHVEKLMLRNYRCYENLEIDFEKRLTVIVGENGRGKTAIFDALAVSFSPYLQQLGASGRGINFGDVRKIPRYNVDSKHIEGMEMQYPVEICADMRTALGKEMRVSKIYNEQGEEKTTAEGIVGYGRDLLQSLHEGREVLLPLLSYYGTARIWVDSSLLKDTEYSLQDRLHGYNECLEPSSSYHTFGEWFKHITQLAEHGGKYEELKRAVGSAIEACLKSTGLHDLRYDLKLDCFVITHPEMGELVVDYMSDGFRSIISMVADIAYRIVRLNPYLGERAMLKTPGIIMIDEVEMHLHPLWQQRVMLDIMDAFPEIQFIVTTHSAQLLSSVPADAIRVLRWNRDFEGIGRVEFSLGAKSYQLLQDIQNVDPRPEVPITKELHRYLELVGEDRWDSEEALQLRKKLDEWSQGHEPDLLKADMDIRLRRFRRQQQ